MRKLFCCFTLLLPLLAGAQGMYIPSLLDSAVMADMNAKGSRLTKEDIYSINHSSLKDAVLQFAGGCTGEMISGEGLLVTNHHCGLGQIQRHSSVEHDYLTNGFWAKNSSEELACPGLTVTFIVSITDVTDSILPLLSKTNNEYDRYMAADAAGKKIGARAIAGKAGLGAFVRPFYMGNQYFLFITQTFKDVRMVGAPPVSVGNFGGDTDNWEWPRHTGDFSLFRIYADKNNMPADYNKDNVPYKPKHFFPVSIKGVKEGDFTMVYGFPGSTQQYLTSYAVDLIENVTDPERVAIRTARLKILDAAMRGNDTIRIQYAGKYNGVANAWKKWQGEAMGLRKSNVVKKKMDFEEATLMRNNEMKQSTGLLLSQMKTLYDSLRVYQTAVNYTSEALLAPEVFRYAAGWKKTIDYLKTPDAKVTDSLKNVLKKNAEGFFKDYNADVDENVMATLLQMYMKNVKREWWPAFMKEQKTLSAKLVPYIYFDKSVFDNKNDMLNVIDNLSAKSTKKLEKDPLYRFAISSYAANDSLAIKYNEFDDQLDILNREYMKVLMQTYPERKFFPDANLTLRVAYGNVKSFNPRNGVTYKYYTTTDGILEKYYSQSAPDYKLLPGLKTLLERKDFGEYAENGELHTGFIATNHTTGGNSGSPVLDADGNLIGVNFDRVWEGTMSDINFDANICRNISLDVRYMLFIIDKYAGAGYLLKEMKIVR